MHDRTNESGQRSDDQTIVTTSSQLGVSRSTADHGITITVTRIEEGVPFSWPWRASCLCGWLSEPQRSRPSAKKAGESHLATAANATRQQLADEYGVTIHSDMTAELRRPAWCDTDERWLRYRSALEAAWPEVAEAAIARANGVRRGAR